ncbi:proline dehydrogenase family protein [Spongiivirga citrea]|uniref:Proline dehydrogenase n=1 Tax=Spongiivirga citrea TaxID=1481457 RepID=A0A6M0CKH5_9FLAO|nr:proline dehydrogenase family protein [Spongiivirga citrea]NER16464.1 proline dehydrogenase [Spongiivirga citrea]
MIASNIFENTKNAFALKSDSELERAYFLFKLIGNEPLVKIGTAVTNFALKAHLPVEGLIRATVFDHFCGGVNESDCLPKIDRMYTKGIQTILDYSVEGKENEEDFDAAMNKKISLIDFANNKEEIPFAVMKPTALGRFEIWQKVTEKVDLTAEEQAEWERTQKRIDAICKAAHNANVGLLIDAEESWMQDASDDLVEEMMRRYNKNSCIIYNTLQCYRWDRLDYMKQLHQKGQAEGFIVGMKIVRGAYMEKENDRAEEKGYATPICKDKATTDKNFNSCMRYILDNLSEISLFVGTHNEESTLLCLQLMEELNIEKNVHSVWFGQLYGMSDQITYNLAQEGYNTIKLIPFGPVKEVMPYLIRRAEENTSVAGQTSRELELLKNERKRRKLD